jgi:hypothetical protein
VDCFVPTPIAGAFKIELFDVSFPTSTPLSTGNGRFSEGDLTSARSTRCDASMFVGLSASMRFSIGWGHNSQKCLKGPGVPGMAKHQHERRRQNIPRPECMRRFTLRTCRATYPAGSPIRGFSTLARSRIILRQGANSGRRPYVSRSDLSGGTTMLDSNHSWATGSRILWISLQTRQVTNSFHTGGL